MLANMVLVYVYISTDGIHYRIVHCVVYIPLHMLGDAFGPGYSCFAPSRKRLGLTVSIPIA